MDVEGCFFMDESFSYSTAGGALAQFYIARSTAQGLAGLCQGSSGGANRPLGIVQNDPSAAGDAVTLRLEGYSKLTAGGTITAGDLVRPPRAVLV